MEALCKAAGFLRYSKIWQSQSHRWAGRDDRCCPGRITCNWNGTVKCILPLCDNLQKLESRFFFRYQKI